MLVRWFCSVLCCLCEHTWIALMSSILSVLVLCGTSEFL